MLSSRKIFLFAALLCFSAAGFAQGTVLEKVWTTSSSTQGLEQMNERVDKLVTSVSKNRYNSEIDKLHALFRKTHNRFLHSYVQYTGIEGLTKGRFDCLTATSLFADILTRSGFRYKIIETNYHIFIVVNTVDGNVLLETTDRFAGFISDKRKIEETLAAYRKNTLVAATSSHHLYAFRLFNAVKPDQLSGLLYFNQAVKAYNAHQWAECSEKLSAAAQTNNSPRIAELAALIPSQP